MLRVTSSDSKIVRLVLAVGSRAGLEAPLHTGYYMIGRHKECQIRPKSRSVSRRHCLLHNGNGVLRLFDLNSTAGTFKNEERLEPGSWYEVGDRDEVRCGKVLFVVAFDKEGAPEELSETDGVDQGFERRDAQTEASILRGAAWQDVDVAGFLESEDEADREIRYDNIRSSKRTNVDEPESGLQPESEPEQATEESDSAKEGREETGKRVARKNKLSSKTTPVKRAKRFRRTAWSGGDGDLLERGKVAGLTLLAATVVTFFCYSVYSFYAGPETKVLQEID
ncbi:MAG TPA: hypothetical protein DEF45_23030 [Rhodopirellula sp.]|nr:MAG: hypothetical protein CBD74_10515 [Saprospirales bacterium TMED214]HBV65886.1 hypothetical protein [Rhodopirellula sp.]